MSESPNIYIISSAESNLVCIGATKNVQGRLFALQSASAVSLALLTSIPLPTWNDARSAEQRIYRQLAKQRKHGNWFDVEKDIIVAVVSALIENKKQSKTDAKIKQENKWKADGKLDHDSGIPFSQPPAIGRPYSGLWYRAKEAWETGWKNAQRAEENNV